MTRRFLFIALIGAVILEARVSMIWLRNEVAHSANRFIESYKIWAEKMNAHTKEGQLDYRAIAAWRSGSSPKTTGKSLPKLFQCLEKKWNAWKRGM
jgi:hypothetical protein